MRIPIPQTNGEYLARVRALPADIRRYHAPRWPFVQDVVRAVADVVDAGLGEDKSGMAFQDARRVLEVGPYHLPVVPGCDTIDLRPRWGAEFVGDAHRLDTWPPAVAAVRRDLVIAIQVFEHIGTVEQTWQAFCNLRGLLYRPWGRLILSVPFRWPESAGVIHAGVDWALIRRWTAGALPLDVRVSGHTLQRMILVYGPPEEVGA